MPRATSHAVVPNCVTQQDHLPVVEYIISKESDRLGVVLEEDDIVCMAATLKKSGLLRCT